MTTETAAQARLRDAAIAYDRGIVRASRNIAARSRHRSWHWGPLAGAGIIVAYLLLPKRLRKAFLSASFPLVAASLRGLFK